MSLYDSSTCEPYAEGERLMIAPPISQLAGPLHIGHRRPGQTRLSRVTVFFTWHFMTFSESAVQVDSRLISGARSPHHKPWSRARFDLIGPRRECLYLLREVLHRTALRNSSSIRLR